MAVSAALDPAVYAEAYESSVSALCVDLAGAGGGQVLRQSDALITMLPFEHFANTVHSPRFSHSAAPRRIAAILDLFRARNVGVRFRLGPSSAPDLAACFERPRFVRIRQPYMASPLGQLHVGSPHVAGLEMYPVADYALFQQRKHLAAGSMRPPKASALLRAYQKLANERPRKHWTLAAEQEGRIVASACLYFHEATATGYGFQVERDRRRQGIGTALLGEMYALAREQGAELAVLASSAMGMHFYPHFGFRNAGRALTFHCSRERLMREPMGSGGIQAAR
jgi:GNAT superfamily N-acetyltransferase